MGLDVCHVVFNAVDVKPETIFSLDSLKEGKVPLEPSVKGFAPPKVDPE